MQQEKSNKYNILVIGDSCTDIFKYGKCNRLAPEGPVPVFVPTREKICGGMAKNVVNITNSEIVTKTRYVEEKTNHLIMRVDTEGDKVRRYNNIKDLNLKKYRAIVISDYDKGFLSEDDIEYICSNHDLVFIDTKRIFGKWIQNAKFIKINYPEYKATKNMINKDLEDKLLITMGGKGCKHKEILYPVEEVEVKDLTGAGDTFLSALCLKYITSENISESINYANECATLVVQMKGTTTP